MRLDELEEAEVKKAVFTFGRLNPPHFGHHALIQTLQKTAEKQGCDWFLFVSSKTGDEKNPLTYEQKVWWIQALFPETKGHLVVDPSIKTPLVAATWLFKKGYNAATFVAGEDDMSSYGEMIKSGNAHGQKNPDAVKAGKGFVFEPLDFAISPRLASATNARRNVTDGDPEAFVRSILGPKINPKLAELVHDQLYPTVRKALGLGESVGESAELNKTTPSVRDLAKKYATDPAVIHRQVNRGVKVEFEHTNDIEVATEIAMDHLKERLDYYDLLDKLETTPKKKFGENFADGKGPGRPGDSQRHSIPKKASIEQLEKAAKASGRKGQLARWQLNMRRGKKKATEDGPFASGTTPYGNNLIDRQVAINPWDVDTPHPKEIDEVADQPYRFISPVSTATTQKSMFQTDSGTTIQVFIQVDTGNGVADIGFFDATDKENPTIGMTGKGDAFRVFATVGSIVKQFVAKRKPPYISFSGKSSDAGRIKLYDMIAKNIGRYLPEYKLINSGNVAPDDIMAYADKVYTFKRVAQESVNENVDLTPEDVYKKNKLENLGISFEEFERYVDQAIQNHSKLYTYWHKFKDHKKSYHLAQQEVLKNLYRNKAYYMSKPVIKLDPIDPSMSDSDWWKNKISEEKKPKKPKTIIDGALKTLIAKGRSEDEAIADLKKEIDSKFYELDESLNERKMADLYHSTDIDNLAAILKSGQLTPGRNVYVSLTRDKNYLFAKDSSVEYAVFVIDQAKLAYNKKIEPYDFHMSDEEDPEDFARDIEARRSESEERVKGPISLRYVKAIMMPVSWSPENMKKEIEAAKQQDGDDYRSDLSMTSLVKQRCGKKLRIIKTFQKLGINVNFSIEENLEETLKKVKGEWALVSRKNPKKVLQYYHGSGHPSKDWVSKVERRVHSFESIMEDDAKPRVYLDMDGVLADFFGEWARLAKVDHYKDINDPEENLQLVRDHPTFWVDLPMLPHAKALIKTVIEHYGEYRICSKPLEGDVRSKSGKMEWIRKHLSDMMPAEVILTADKAAFATQDGAPSILVDDFGVNIDAWKAAGGIGIKYDDSQFPKVANILTKLAK